MPQVDVPIWRGFSREEECGPHFVHRSLAKISTIKGTSTCIKNIREEQHLLVAPNLVKADKHFLTESMIL